MEEKDEDEETIVEDVGDHKYHKCFCISSRHHQTLLKKIKSEH